jgi:NDP-sugar pyrophosphorylase family protein
LEDRPNQGDCVIIALMTEGVHKAVILAAGEGTRLRPLTLDRPKPMVPIAGRPLLERTVEWLRDYGIGEVAINLHYRPEAIRDHFDDGRRFGVAITYSYEPTLRGTAGALKPMQAFLDDTFVIVYGDVLTDLDLGALIAFHRAAPGAQMTLSLYRVPNPTEKGLVEIDATGRVLRFVEKPPPDQVFTDLASAGIIIAEPAILDFIPDEGFDDIGHHLLPRLLAAGVPMYGWPLPEGAYLMDIGSPEQYAQAQVWAAGRGAGGD